MPNENAPTRKPGTAMLTKYLDGDYDLENSFVIGDRLTDVQLAKNLGSKAIFFHNNDAGTKLLKEAELENVTSKITESWDDIFEARLFASYIYKEDNVYDRKIQEYATGKDALYESERIKEELFNFEHDLWSY